MLTKFTALAMGVLLSVSAMAADMATLTRQAQSGDAAVQSDLAHEYYSQGNHAKAFEWATKAAGQGHAAAQNNLGVMYREGEGVRRDSQKAVEWYTKAANQGNAKAQHNLGWMYYNGQGVSQNKSTAKRYFGQACLDSNGMLGCDEYHELDQQGH